jgi:hypothetical protein
MARRVNRAIELLEQDQATPSPSWDRSISACRSDMSMSRASPTPEMQTARERVFAACRANRVAFLEGRTPETIVVGLDEGVRVIAGHREDTARIGRAHQRRTMAV